MSESLSLHAPEDRRTKPQNDRLSNVILRLVKGGPEQQAIEAGEIDAVVDYSDGRVILFPVARRALCAPRSAPKGESAAEPVANSLLAALTRSEYQRLRPFLVPVTLTSGEVLYEPGTAIKDVYFPVDCVVSLQAAAKSRRTLEVGLVGFEGMVGTSLAMGVNVSSLYALVQTGGTALRMSGECFRKAIDTNRPLRRELNLYIHTELDRAKQTAICSTFHLIEERLASRLLMARDRVRSNRVYLTQKFLSGVLGVRRESITEAAIYLQKRRLISYNRGNISILNLRGLESASCGCYGVSETHNNKGIHAD
jgi:CRP-like cAMP-binding protein